MIIGMREKTRRAEVRVLGVEGYMVKLCVDREREQWLSVGDVLWVDVPGEPSQPAGGGVVDELHAAQQAQFDQTGRTIKPEVPESRVPIAASWPREHSAVWVCPRCERAHEVTGAIWLDCACGARYRFVYGDESDGGRWAAFSDEEVQILHTALLDAEQVYTELTDAAKAMIEEVMTEYARRTKPVAGYRGPGVYETFTGLVYEVLGRIGSDGAVILRRVGGEDGMLYAEVLADFNDVREDGAPTYRWVRALGEEG